MCFVVFNKERVNVDAQSVSVEGYEVALMDGSRFWVLKSSEFDCGVVCDDYVCAYAVRNPDLLVGENVSSESLMLFDGVIKLAYPSGKNFVFVNPKSIAYIDDAVSLVVDKWRVPENVLV